MMKGNREVESYRKNTKKINEILKHQGEFRKTYGDRGYKSIENGFKMMKKMMDDRVRGVDSKASAKQGDSIKDALRHISEILIFKEVTDMIRDLSLEFSKLAFNWNKQFLGSQEITVQTRMIDRIARDNLLLRDSYTIAKKAIKKLELTIDRDPLRFEVAKHYLEELKK